MKRIVIVGATGSGKTTLGRKLSEKLSLTAIDLDELHWLPDWQEREVRETRKMVDAATQDNASWAVSGNYRELQDIFWQRADTAIWIDYPFLLVFWQLLKRSIHRIVHRQSICNGNYETWRKFLSHDSIMLWLFKSYWRRKREYGDIFLHPEQHAHLTLIRLKSPQETALFLEKLP